ncbi:MAG TPA: helix-turn-helix domain-containing protein [Nocardioides sp.]
MLAAAIEHFAAHGIGDMSLRTMADRLGTSHRMLIYHFGSREGLLAAVVHAVEADQRAALAMLVAETGREPMEQVRRFWARVADATEVYGRLFFELASDALYDRPHAEEFRAELVDPWLTPLAELWERAGMDRADAPAYARLGLGAARGLLLDLLATGDRAAVDEAAEALHQLFEAKASGYSVTFLLPQPANE